MAGSNKTAKKQRAYKEHCRLMRTSGYITDSHGVWTQNYKAYVSEASFHATTAK
jgi:hypothetical protein